MTACTASLGPRNTDPTPSGPSYVIVPLAMGGSGASVGIATWSVGHALADAVDHLGTAPDVEEAGYPPAERQIPHLPARRTSPDPVHATFDVTGAQEALHDVRVACGVKGAPRGYGHAHVTFANDGTCTRVEVDAPSGLSPEGVQCVGESLLKAKVPAFEGAPVTVGVTYFVGEAAGG